MNSNTLEMYIETYGKDIYSFCVYLTRNKQDADDLYQQTFLVAIEKNEMDEARNIKSYLIAIAANIWNNQKRKFQWRTNKAKIVYFQEENLEQLSDDAGTVEDAVVELEQIEMVRKLVDVLPDKMRVVILMRYMQDMSVESIAKALNIPTGTVKSRLHQAKNRLKEGMKEYEG